jgi:hypothetical protein
MAGHEVRTVSAATIKSGELLALAAGQFEAFVTVDRNRPMRTTRARQLFQAPRLGDVEDLVALDVRAVGHDDANVDLLERAAESTGFSCGHAEQFME